MKKLWQAIRTGRAAQLGLALSVSAAFSLWAPMVHADCRADLSKYRMDSVLYEGCAHEALKNKDAELLYLVGLWNHYGIREPLFYMPPSLELYKKFMRASADLGNPDAQSMYYITESKKDAAENKDGKADPKVAEFRKALEQQKDAQSRFRLIQIKQIEGTLGEKDIDELAKLAADPNNYEAAFYYAQLLAGNADPSRPETLAKPIEIYEKLLKIPDTVKNVDSIKGQTLWQLVRIYSANPKAEVYSKAEPYLVKLAQNGDVFAMEELSRAYATSRFGVLSEGQAYAWQGRAADCAVGTFGEDSFLKKFKALSAQLSAEDKLAGIAYYVAVASSTKCMRSKLITRKIDENGKLVEDKQTKSEQPQK